MKFSKQLISKHQKTIKVLVVISFFILLPIACKKQKVHEPTFCELNPDQCAPITEAKDFFLFKMGSWWVYEEETSKERDSVYVTIYQNTDNYDFNAEYYSSYSGYNYHYFPFALTGKPVCDINSSNSEPCLHIKRNRHKPGGPVDEEQCFFVYYKINYKLSTFSGYMNQCTDNYIMVTDIFKNYALNNFTFGKTVKVFEKCQVSENNQSTNIYYSKNIGIIRKELLDSSQVWNLVNYHVEL